MALPSGYSQLRYIQSSGTQYIDTGFKPNQNTRVVLRCNIINSGETVFVFGARIAYQNTSFTLHIEGGVFKDHYGSNVWTSAISDSGEHLIDKNKNVTTIDGTSYTYTTETFQSAYNFQLFALNQAGSVDSRRVSMKIYSCRIYDNGMLVRDFVPAMDSSGTVGLYDLANNTFYANAGTGSFTAGPLVTGPVDGVGVCIINAASFAINAGKCILNGAVKEITEGMTLTAGTAKKIALKSGIDVAAMAISYTGAYTDQLDVVMSGKTYRLLTLTGSGTLTVPEEVTADVWMCNGGNSGYGGTFYGSGGGGGYLLQKEGITINGSCVCVIGSGAVGNYSNYAESGGNTSFDSATPQTQQKGPNGASGGGGRGGGSSSTGTGKGISTVPFMESGIFDPHSAGGGGGALSDAYEDIAKTGGNGGSNGSNGERGQTDYSYVGTGGNKGGGSGGEASRSTNAGENATFYGSGGGGGGSYTSSKGSGYAGKGGAGYQGVIYVRIPYEQ